MDISPPKFMLLQVALHIQHITGCVQTHNKKKDTLKCAQQ